MTITAAQLAAIAPYAAPFTLHALADGEGCSGHLSTTLAVHGLTEPAVAAQFVAACVLASKWLVSFVAPQPLGAGHALFQTPEGWIDARANDWHGWHLSDDAREWDFNYIVDKFAERFDFTNGYPEIWRTLQTVCDALGVRNGFSLGVSEHAE